MNPRSRRAALYAIATVAILASINALAHSYVGLYGWAKTHGMTGWQATTWPAEVDVFLVIGELALYIAYLDLWPTRHKTWPWITAAVGLAISIAGNVGHIHAVPGGAAITARLTAATSPLAAFAGLAIALLVLKGTRTAPHAPDETPPTTLSTGSLLLATIQLARQRGLPEHAAQASGTSRPPAQAGPSREEQALLHDARAILQEAHRSGIQLTQRGLATELRGRGHRVANASLKHVSASIGLPSAATQTQQGSGSHEIEGTAGGPA